MKKRVLTGFLLPFTSPASLRTQACCCLPSKGPSHLGCPLQKIRHIVRLGEWLHQSFTDIWAGGVPCHLTPFSTTDGFTLAPSIPINGKLGGLRIAPISLACNGFHSVLRTQFILLALVQTSLIPRLTLSRLFQSATLDATQLKKCHQCKFS